MYKKIMQDARTIYSWLNDDESRNIFVNRLAWLISGEERYLDPFRNVRVSLKYPQVRGTGAKKLIQRVKELSQPVIIYGGGGIGTGVFELLRQEGIMPKCFWDKDEKKQRTGVCGVLTQMPGADYTCETVIAATGWYTDEVLENLRRLEIPEDRVIVPEFTEVTLDVDNSYFDPDIIHFEKNEVFVDGGCFNFGTSQILLKKWKDVKSIYAFEPDENQWLAMQDGIQKSGFSNTHFIKKGLWSETTDLYFTQTFGGGSNISESGTVRIPVTSIDEAVQEPVTFIKMDIEGSELEALKGAARHIVVDRPKLAICVYHKPEDMFEIAMYIKSLVPAYRLFLRHYSSTHLDTVLYAVI